MNELEQLLKDLVEIPSPNPPGDARPIAAYIADWLTATRAEIRVLNPPEKVEAQSVIASIGHGAPVIMLHAHIDTVPVAGTEEEHWTSDPFTATVRDGRLYGKGSVDDKAPLAAMMMTLKNVAALDAEWNGTLVLVAAAEEEVGGRLGTHWLARSGHLPSADMIVVGEQTHNRAASAHKGVMRARVTTRGRSVHATNPDRGINAINAMARVVLALEEYHVRLRSRSHPLVGVPTCNVGTISGGSTENAVPDICTIRLDRRMIPREDPAVVEQELKDVIASVHGVVGDVEIGDFLFSSWFDSPLSTELGQLFVKTVAHITEADPGPIGYLPGSDAKHLMSLSDGDMVIFGPGSYELAHRHDEFVELKALNECEAVLATFVRSAFGATGRHGDPV